MPDLLEFAERLSAQAGPGEQVEVYVTRGSSTTVKAYDGEVESLTNADSAGVGVRVIADQRQGFAHAGSLDDAIATETLQEARDNARFGEPDEHLGLVEPDGVEPLDHGDRWRPAVLHMAASAKIDLALDLERRVTALDPRVTSVRSATYGDSFGERAIASSRGIGIWTRATSCGVSVSALATQDDETQIGGAHDRAREPSELDPGRVADDAVERATRLLGATQPATQQVQILLEPRLAATLIGIAAATLTGERVLKGRSPFADRLGSEIAARALTVIDDPTDHRSLAAAPHDAEGLASRRNPLIEAGVLQQFLQNSYTGRRNGSSSTASAARGYAATPGVGCRALSMEPGATDPGELLQGISQGLLVQSMSGLHSGVNPVSGDFSVGADGIMIRRGERAEPVREVTLASTLQRLLLNVSAVGNDLEWLPGGTGAATIVVDDVALSGA